MDEVLDRIASALERIAESNEKLASWAIGDNKKVISCASESTEIINPDNDSPQLKVDCSTSIYKESSPINSTDEINSSDESSNEQVECKPVITRSHTQYEGYVSIETLRKTYHGVVAPVIRKQAVENNIECFVFKKHDYFLKSDLKKLVKVCKLRKRNNVALIENKAKNS